MFGALKHIGEAQAKEAGKKVKINIMLNGNLWRQVKAHAAMTDQSASGYIEKLVAKDLKKQEKQTEGAV